MNKKYTLTILIAVLLIGVPSPALCATDKHEATSNCCADKSVPIPSPSENCLWHCDAKNIIGLKAEGFSIENLNVNTRLSLQHKIIDTLLRSSRHSAHSADYYLRLETSRLSACQNYSEAALNRAPPPARSK